MQTTIVQPVRDVERAMETEGRMVSTIDRLQNAIVDANAPSTSLRAAFAENEEQGGSVWARGVLEARDPASENPVRLNILQGAHQQIANKLDIPFKYYQRMLERQDELWVNSVNIWLHETNKKRLLRMLRPMDDAQERFAIETNTQFNLRAFLSDRYHIIDHKALIETILPVLRENNAYVTQFNLDDQHFHVRFATEEVEILERFYEEQPNLRGMQELIAFGGALRNSETGHGAFHLGPSVNITRCTNVLVTTDRMRIVHLGGRSSDEERFYRRDTKVMDDTATIMKVRDRVEHIFSSDSQSIVARTIAEGAGKTFEIPEELSYIEFIGNIGKTYKLSDEEIDVFQNEFVSEAVDTGRTLQHGAENAPSRWTMAQAMTATAKRLDDRGGLNFDRRDEIETMGWELLTSPTNRLLKAAKAATN